MANYRSAGQVSALAHSEAGYLGLYGMMQLGHRKNACGRVDQMWFK